MIVGDMCNRHAVIIGKSDSIYHASELMRAQHTNYLVVVESQFGNNIPIGCLSERGIVMDAVAERLDLNDTIVADIMQTNQLISNEHDDVMQTIKRMRHDGVRCIPVVNTDRALIGILSIDDILDRLSELLNDIVYILSRQQMPLRDLPDSRHDIG